MALSFWTEEKYRTHFFCALCGGPFARVYRTDEVPQRTRAPSVESCDEAGHVDETYSVPQGWNRPLSADERYTGTETLVEHELDDGGIFGGPYGHSEHGLGQTAWRAYDGRHISEEDMRWTRVIRALIHRSAQVHPDGGLEQLDDESDVYLTGRGRVLEDASWAIAHPPIEDEVDNDDNDDDTDLDNDDDDDDDDTVLALSSERPYRFHLYQEPDRTDRKFRISSIPFHEECWYLFRKALRSSRATRGLNDIRAGEDYETIWSYLCDLIPTAVTGRLSDLTSESLASGTAEDPITRLSIGCMGRMGYREAQRCSDGPSWLHLEGLHWLAANPRRKKLPHNPFIGLHPSETSRTAFFQKRNTIDPFWEVPGEVLVQIVTYLSCSDVFKWRKASMPLNLVIIPQREYRRFFLEQVAFLPGLIKQMKAHETDHPGVNVDWRLIFEDVSRAWRQDNGLRNRRRIWKIVHPMAEELVERSCQNLRAIGNLSPAVSAAISVVRGNVGVPSGASGEHETLVFSELFRPTLELRGRDPSRGTRSPLAYPVTWPAWEDSVTTPCHALKQIDIWLHPQEHYLCGLRFSFLAEGTLHEARRTTSNVLGTRSTLHQTLVLERDTQMLTGINVCRDRNLLSGIQFVFEDTLEEPTEYCKAEFLSACYGVWRGPERRLVAPRKFRTFAGLTAFIKSAGHIETLAILEKKRPVMSPSGLHFLTPPDSVPLSHREASLWRSSPPNDVDLMERLGPCVGDWRIWSAQNEVFAATSLYQPPGILSKIIQYSDGAYLCGIRFQYKTEAGKIVYSDLGDCDAELDVTLSLVAGDEVSFAVVGHGRTGIRSLQLATSSRKIAPACGSRYIGAHTAYALKRSMSRVPREISGHLAYLDMPIIGFHCLYSSVLRRIVQLGIVTRVVDSKPLMTSATIPSTNASPEPSSSPSVGVSLPFIDIDELSNPWVDGHPPDHLLRGRKNSDSMKALRVASSANFAGWVSLRERISRVVVYGHMEGLRFSYHTKGRRDLCFGNTSRHLSHKSYGFRNTRKAFHYIGQEKSSRAEALPRIRLAKTVHTTDTTVEWEVASKYLAAIKFNFCADRIIDWQPLFDYSVPDGQTLSEAELRERQSTWKSPDIAKRYPLAEADQDVLNFQPVLVDFFVSDEESGKVDAVKGYVMRTSGPGVIDGVERDVGSTRFCGLRFRRHGLWDEEALGQVSAYEVVFALRPHEEIVSMSVSRARQFGARGAVSLTTNHGRDSPWIGDPPSGSPLLKCAPPGRRAVGLYLAYSDPRHCNAVGLIHDVANGGGEDLTMLPITPPDSSLPENYVRSWPDLAPDSEVMLSKHRLSKALNSENGPYDLTRPATTLVDSGNLELIEAHINTVPGRYGLKALRFSGNRRMGTVMVGDWQGERAKPGAGQTMQIKGIDGERVTGIDVTFQRHPLGNRIIGLLIRTSHGQARDIASWAPFTDENPPDLYREYLECKVEEQVIGFRYAASLYVHDITMIVQPKSQT